MIYAEAVTCIINKSVGAIYPDAKLHGIARLITDKREETDKGGIISPAICNDNGEAYPVDLGDNDMEMYHRVISITASQSNRAGFGRSLNPLQVKMKMCMVIFSDTTITKTPADVMALQIFSIIERKHLKAIAPGVKNTSILINDTILNDSQVFGEEFKNVDNFLGPEHSLIKINYTVESTVYQKCFNTLCQQTY